MSSSKSDQSSTSSSSKFKRSNSNNAIENSSRGYSENGGTKKMESKRDDELMIGEIEQRLKLVEEEDQIMKETLLKGLEERRKLMNDIHKEFQEINNKYIQIKNQEECSQPFSIKHLMERNANGGLMQVLWQESNPLLVTRDFRPQPPPPPSAELPGSSS